MIQYKKEICLNRAITARFFYANFSVCGVGYSSSAITENTRNILARISCLLKYYLLHRRHIFLKGTINGN
nr:MAG TPA: hypothetical protein [Caudoviricetes sp.]